jgi:hypothetical protein
MPRVQAPRRLRRGRRERSPGPQCYLSRPDPVRPRRRKSFALLVSLLSHVLLVGGFANGFALRCVPEFEMPDIELEMVEVELVDPDALQGEDPDPVPEPPPPVVEPQPVTPPPPTPTDETSEQQKPPPVPEPEEPAKFAEKGSNADKLAPPQSTFHMLLVPKKIRKLPFSQQVLDIMAPLPDFELLIDAGGLDAMRDFDHIVIASPNIQDWTQTFLAVDYRISRAEVQRAIERAVAADDHVIEWVEDGGLLRGNPRPKDPKKKDGDNRWFVFLEGKIAIYVRDEFLPSILEGPAGDDRKTAGNFVANLAKLRRFAERQPDAGMQLVFKGLTRILKKGIKIGGKPLPFKIPDGFEVSASAAQEPEVVIRGEFTNVVEAKAFVKWWDDELSALLDGSFTLKLTVGWIYDLLAVERDGVEVTLRGQMTTDQAVKAMQLIADGTRKIAEKTPEEIAAMRQRRIDAWKARRSGKLPPSALDAKAADAKAPDAKQPPAAEDPPKTPPTPPTPVPEPAKTPVNDPAGGDEPD